jgi:hypothetical protein
MNRQCFPSSLFPLRGDVSAEAGATSVQVIGLQTKQLGPNPLINGYVPTYDVTNDGIEWRPSGGGTAVALNGVVTSSDYLFLVNTAFTNNYSTDNFLGVRINSVRDGG